MGLNRVLGDDRKVVAVSAANSPYRANVHEDVFEVDTSAGPTTIILPPAVPANGDAYLFVDVTGDAATNPITVDGNGHDIDGNPTATIATNKDALELLGFQRSYRSIPGAGTGGDLKVAGPAIITYRQNGTTAAPVYATWDEIKTIVEGLQGNVIVRVDSSLMGPSFVAHVPAASGVTEGFATAVLESFNGFDLLEIDDGAQLHNWAEVSSSGVQGKPTTIPSILIDNGEQFRMRDDANFALLAGATLPLIAIGGTPSGGGALLLSSDLGNDFFDNSAAPGVGVLGLVTPVPVVWFLSETLLNATGSTISGTVQGVPGSLFEIFSDDSVPALAFPLFAGTFIQTPMEEVSAVVNGPGRTVLPSATGTNSLVGGNGATDQGQPETVVLGINAGATRVNVRDILIGEDANGSVAGNAIAIGFLANSGTPAGHESVGIGTICSSPGEQAVAIGTATTAAGDQTIAAGFNASAPALASTALGTGTSCAGAHSSALGEDSQTIGDFSAALAPNTQTDLVTEAVLAMAARGNKPEPNKRSILMPSGETPGTVIGESVVLELGGALGAPMSLVDGQSYIADIRGIAQGVIHPGETTACRGFRGCFVMRKTGGVLALFALDAFAGAGDGGAASWTLAASASVGDLVLTFTTGATRATATIDASVELTAVSP